MRERQRDGIPKAKAEGMQPTEIACRRQIGRVSMYRILTDDAGQPPAKPFLVRSGAAAWIRPMSAVAKTREPLYPVAYAATLAGLDSKTAHRWLRGYDFVHKGQRRRSEPVVPPPHGIPANDRLSI